MHGSVNERKLTQNTQVKELLLLLLLLNLKSPYSTGYKVAWMAPGFLLSC